ncbi:peptidoglycan-binding domain-containing protein [Phytohabitans flavus]|uniref:peptidoglycan-binding domain-containing protein n=1 Tax=Phytohabitans flavus TaxID=1076124 RepID=UPI0036440087
MTAPVLTALERFAERTDERWLYGPRALPGEFRSYTTGFATWRGWVSEVERSWPDPAAVVARLRLAGEPGASRWPVGRLLATISADAAIAPLTTADLSRRALDGLYRTGQVEVERDAAGQPSCVDLDRVLLLLDARLNGTTATGSVIDPEVAFGWPGLLAEAWYGYEERRRAAKAAAERAGQPWTEPAGDLTQPRRWLDESILAHCPVERLFGMMDGTVLAGFWTPLHAFGATLERYYGPAVPADRFESHAANRGRRFVLSAGIDHTVRADGTVVLGNGVQAAVVARVRTAAAWLSYLDDPVTAALRWAAIEERLDSPWGAAMLTELGQRFTAFLTAVVNQDGTVRGGWPQRPTALAAYGGFALRAGDSDTGRRFGGYPRSGNIQPANPVAALQARLRDLGFAVQDATGEFATSTAAAVRELQFGAYANEVSAVRSGVASRRPAHRRYLGAATGVVDEETARAIDVWHDPGRYGVSGVDRFVRTTLAGIGAAELLRRCQAQLFRWSALTEGRAHAGLTDAQWRAVGDAQKAQLRRRLVRRSRYADDPHGATDLADVVDPHFAFDSDDLENVFQLEAVAEFYANYTDPWLPLAEVRVPGENVPRAPGDSRYVTADMLDPSGEAARAVPPPAGSTTTKKVVLDGTVDLSRVWTYGTSAPHRDLIYLAGATSRASKWYKINGVDVATRTLTLDSDPKMGTAPCAWKIRIRPRLVLIDPLGHRPGLRGEHAAVASPAEQDARIVKLDAGNELATVNINFDTIYLPGDTARASKTYRIVGCDRDSHTVTLDGAPRLDAHHSAWQIPAGVGGEFTPLETEFTANKAGVDYYEGVMFTVFDGRVHTALSWTSYTSCREEGGGLSSVRGNTEYATYSWVSENNFRNYSFVVTEKRLPDPDHIDVGRYYFDGMANPPGSWPAPAPPRTSAATRTARGGSGSTMDTQASAKTPPRRDPKGASSPRWYTSGDPSSPACTSPNAR